MAEFKEVNLEINSYEEKNASMEDQILANNKKKERLLDVLNANQSRHKSVVKDIKKG